MFSIIGRKPDSKIAVLPRVSVRVQALLTLCVCTVFAGVAAAADPRVPLTLAEAEDLALDHEPGVAELHAAAEALSERAVVAGQLPDPTVRIGLANYPINGGSFSSEAMTQAQLGFRQAFPRSGLRSMNTAHYHALAMAQTETAGTRSLDVLTATRSAWLETYYWQSAEQTLQESRQLFVDLLETTRSLYGVGRNTQSDVLRAELELRRLDERLIDAARSRSAAQAMLSQWLGAEAYRPVADKLPSWNALPSVADLAGSLQHHPSLLAADANIDARAALVGAAEENRKPGWALDVGYGYRDGIQPNGESRSDFVSVAVVVDLPLFRKNRQDRSLAAALSERSAAVSAKRRLVADLQSRLHAEHSRWTELGRRVALYEADILELSRSAAEAAMLAYQSDAGDFSDVMLGQINSLNTRLDFIRLQVERAQSYAVLANLGGLSP